MRLIELEAYNPKTMQLARPIFDRNRRVLLAAGRTIHPKFIPKLKELQLNYIFIEDAVSQGISLEEMVDMPTWLDSVEAMRTVYETAKAQKRIDVRAVQVVCHKMMEEVKKRKVLVLIPTTTITENLRAYAHVINVTLIALQVGKAMHLNQIQWRDLGIGCLLHDIGKMLTTDYKLHPYQGFEFIRKVREISIISAHIAFQHHETLDGQGFPRAIKGNEIQDFAQICSLANEFDNYVSRDSLPPHEALEGIMAKGMTQYKSEIVREFMLNIPAYPPGTKVKMGNGREAIVVRITTNMQRPVIKYLDDETEENLVFLPTALITSVVKEEPAPPEDLVVDE